MRASGTPHATFSLLAPLPSCPSCVQAAGIQLWLTAGFPVTCPDEAGAPLATVTSVSALQIAPCKLAHTTLYLSVRPVRAALLMGDSLGARDHDSPSPFT